MILYSFKDVIICGCAFLFLTMAYSCLTFILLLQHKIAKDSDTAKFEEEDIILKVGESLEARILFSLNTFFFNKLVTMNYKASDV